MTELLGVLSYLALPLIGWSVVALPAVSRMGWTARVAVAGATGALIVTIVMSLLSLARVAWTAPRLIVVFAAIAAIGIVITRRLRRAHMRPVRDPLFSTITVAFLILAAYGALSARTTSGDMSFFWQPKGVRFFLARRIDVQFLRTPDYWLMHSDYPPLLPAVYAWSNFISGYFATFAAVFASVLFLAATVAVVRDLSGSVHGTALFAAVMAYAYALNFVSGGADPLLLLYETITLAALTFVKDDRSQIALAGIGLAGAVLTKVEGASFLVAVLIAALLMRRRAATILLAAAPAVAVLGAWIFFAWKAELLDAYRGAGKSLYIDAIPTTLRLLASHARFDALWLPWLAPLAVIATGASRRRATLALVVSGLTAAALVYFYIHEPDPTFWIHSSANRSLLPSLMALCFAAAAASSPHPVEDRILGA
jgi:hypothetical protein